MITPRDIPMLVGLASYFLMTRRMIQARYYPADRDGRITRRRLSTLCRDGFVRKQRLLVVSCDDEFPAPVYHLAKGGCQFLAEHFGDDRYLSKPTSVAQPLHLYHYLAVTRTHMVLDDAIEKSDVALVQWCNEHEPLNPENPHPKQHLRLYTQLRKQPRLICAPDAAFLLETRGHRGVFYLEQDRDRDNYSHRRVAALKTPGYAQLLKRRLHRKHFPSSTLNRFTIVMVAPSDKRRDALRRAFAGKDEAHVWRFAAQPDLTPASFLHQPVWYPAGGDDGPQPLVKPEPACTQS